MDIHTFFPIWDRLTKEEQTQLESSAVLKNIKKGTVLHSGSDDCTGLMLVVSGQLRAYILSDEGREVTLYRLFERDFCLFSASCMMKSIQFHIIIETEKDSTIILIPTKIYKQIMEKSAPLSNFTNEIMADRFSEVMWLMEQIMWKSLDKRLASFLLDEMAIDDTTILKLTHEAIANHLGTAREVITRMLRYFQSEGIVKLSRGTIEILDSNALSDLINASPYK